jgi:putative endonuclease
MFRWLAQFWPHSPKQSKLGDRGENVAADYLEQQGFRILERQARGVYGELDLIAVDSDTIVFIEVKTRATSATGDPTEAVTPAKQKKLNRP